MITWLLPLHIYIYIYIYTYIHTYTHILCKWWVLLVFWEFLRRLFNCFTGFSVSTFLFFVGGLSTIVCPCPLLFFVCFLKYVCLGVVILGAVWASLSYVYINYYNIIWYSMILCDRRGCGTASASNFEGGSMLEGRVAVIPFFEALQIDVLAKFLRNPGEILMNSVEIRWVPVNNLGEIPATFWKSVLQDRIPTKKHLPTGQQAGTNTLSDLRFSQTCAESGLCLGLCSTCVLSFQTSARKLWNKSTMTKQIFARQLFGLTCVKSWNSGPSSPAALNCCRAFWGWCTSVFRAKILPVYGFDSIRILFRMGEILKYRIQATPKEIRPEGS